MRNILIIYNKSSDLNCVEQHRDLYETVIIVFDLDTKGQN